MPRVEAFVELVLTDAAEEIQTTVKGYDTATVFPAITETTPTERPFLEYGIGRAVGEDEYIKVYVTSPTAIVVNAVNSKVYIPITKKNLTTGNVSATALTFKDLDRVGSAPVNVPAGVRTEIGKYRVPAKQLIKLGNLTTASGLDKSNGRVLIVPYNT